MPEDFGQLLRHWRLGAGYGLRKFAKIIGELPSNLSGVETGARAPWRQMEKLRKVAMALAFREGTPEWDRFFIAARRTDALPMDLDRMFSRELNLVALRTIDELQLSDEELTALIQKLRKKKRSVKKRPPKRAN